MCVIITHMTMNRPLPRFALAPLSTQLGEAPVVVVTGARQTGKTTLVRDLAPGSRRYHTLDDLDALETAQQDPDRLLLGSEPLTLDEVQRHPAVLSAVKRAVDEFRIAGRFLLTGSANLLRMRRVSESLAGRAAYLTLWPMTRREQLGLGQCGAWDDLLQSSEREWPRLIASRAGEPEDWRALARRGGFPVPALARKTDASRWRWFDGYVRTYLERDLQSQARITALPDFRRVMRAAALRLGGLVNQAELGRDTALGQQTVGRYLNLLETSYLLVRLPAYAVNRTKRIIKAPKLYWGDTGLALHLAGDPGPVEAHLENIVLHDLLAWRDSRFGDTGLFHWRTAGGAEVDFVIEAGDQLLPIEVKATTRPRFRDARHLLTFAVEYRTAARGGLLLHGGEDVRWIAPGVLAAPWWRVL